MQLITGGTGVLGRALQGAFQDAHFPPRSELDICDTESVQAFLDANQPEVFIHAAAMTDVRRAEEEYEECWDANVGGTERLVDALLKVAPDCYFVYVSTACVFDGITGNYDEGSVPCPKNNYAHTKLLGEYVAKRMPRHLIIRTNFVERAPWPYPKAFTDRYGTYLFADDVARGLRQLVDDRTCGLVHVVGDQVMSMYELAILTSPQVGKMTMDDIDIPVTVNMTLRSSRFRPLAITR